MTIKKALEHLDYVLKARKKFIEGLTDPLAIWNRDDDIVSNMVKAMSEELQKDILWMRSIRKQLLPVQHLTRIECDHPKIDHDIDPDGQKYCMNCNADL